MTDGGVGEREVRMRKGRSCVSQGCGIAGRKRIGVRPRGRHQRLASEPRCLRQLQIASRSRKQCIARTHLDQDALNSNTPLLRHAFYEFLNLQRDGLAVRDEALKVARADDVSKGCLSAVRASGKGREW